MRSWWSVGEESLSIDNACEDAEYNRQKASPNSANSSASMPSESKPLHDDDNKRSVLPSFVTEKQQPTLLQAIHISLSSDSLSDFFDCSDEPSTISREQIHYEIEQQQVHSLLEPRVQEVWASPHEYRSKHPDHFRVSSHNASTEITTRRDARDDGLPSNNSLSYTLSRVMHMVVSATNVAVHTAFLPVTVPLHIAVSTTEYVIGTTGSILEQVLGKKKERLKALPSLAFSELDDESSSETSEDEEISGQQMPPAQASSEGVDGSKEGQSADQTSAVFSATAMVAKFALLPVTIPVSIASSTTSAVVNGCTAVVETTGSILELMLGSKAEPSSETKRTEKESSSSMSPSDLHRTSNGTTSSNLSVVTSSGFLSSLFSLSSTMKEITAKATTDFSSMVFDVIAPSLAENRSHHLSDRFLDNLRLDVHLDSAESSSHLESLPLAPVLPVTPVATMYAATSEKVVAPRSPALHPWRSVESSSTSDFLLRVNDLGIYRQDLRNEKSKSVSCVHYVDLTSCVDHDLIQDSLSRLVSRGLGLIANQPNVRVHSHSHKHSKMEVSWEPERGTTASLNTLTSVSSHEQVQQLSTKILVWSGITQGGHTSNFTFFLSRGIVPWRPWDFLEMMWDDSRVKVYNKLCTGRSSLLVLHDEIASGGSTGTKVVRFTTRVPYTNFSVTMTCLMHIRPLEGPDEGGYIIVSRSMSTGRSGTHFATSVENTVETSRHQNDILWGINIIRSVPNQPCMTDLTSISQVGTTIVPNFLARRIGLWGIDDFYKNVRSYAESNCAH